MHELGIVIEIFELLDEITVEQNLSRINSVTIKVGELSGVIPSYFEECWKAAGLGSEMENTALIIENIPAVAKCSCGEEYEMTKHSRICPKCNKTDYEIISGKEFVIEQIEAC